VVEPRSRSDEIELIRHYARVTTSAAQADAFYDEILEGREVWTLRDADGYPAPLDSADTRAMPFWSRRGRVQHIIDNVPAYRAFEPTSVSLSEWRSRWLPGLAKDGLLVGLNWSGGTATGYDVASEDVERNLAVRQNRISVSTEHPLGG
jgi:hypothetical protein